MSHPHFTNEEIVQRGQALYERQIRAGVEAEHTGKLLVVDIETGMYEIDASELVAFHRARAKHPDAALYLLRISHNTAYCIRGKTQVVKPRKDLTLYDLIADYIGTVEGSTEAFSEDCGQRFADGLIDQGK